MKKEKLCSKSEINSGEAKVFEIGDHILALAQIEDEYFCIDDTCSHEKFSLGQGEVDIRECTIECSKHGSLFDLKTGEALTLPAIKPVNCYQLSFEDDDIFVELP